MSPLRIILADDHASVRTSLRLLLECEPDLEVVAEPADGLATLRAVQALQPDLLILDIKMPQMNGLEVLQYLRNTGYKQGVIILSNHSEQLYIAAAMRLGADAFITKSAGAEALLEAVHKVRQKLSLDRHAVSGELNGSEAARSGNLLSETRAGLEQNRREWYEAG